MSTDPFDDVLRPVYGQYQEISQTTFVELVWARKNLVRPAFRPNLPSVADSLLRVAFGKGGTSTPSAPSVSPMVVATSPPPTAYTLSSKQVVSSDAAELAASKSRSTLRSLIANTDVDALKRDVKLQAAPGNVSGFVFHDLNGNGVWDEGEPGMGGWYVYMDADNSCSIALGERAAITSQGTSWPYSAVGSYTINGVPSDPITLSNGTTYYPPWHFRIVSSIDVPGGFDWLPGNYYITTPPVILNMIPGSTIPNVNFGVRLKSEAGYVGSSCPGVCPVDLAVVLDDTGSMGSVITAIKAGIQSVIDILKEAIGYDFRLSLTTFKDSITLRYAYGEDCGEMICGDASIAGFRNALAPVTAGGGGNLAEWSAAAVKFVAEGGAGTWRESAIKAILVVTDAPNNTASNVTANQAAMAAYEAGVRVMYAATPAKDPIMVDEGRLYADTTDGIYVETNAAGLNLPELLTTFIYGLCASSIPPSTCEGGVDHIINGTFGTGIEGWVEFTSPVTWSSTKRAMLVGVGGEAQQTITGLNPGDRLVLTASIETLTAGGIFHGTTLNNLPLVIENGKTVVTIYTATIPDSGEVTIKYQSSGATNSSFYLDNVVACVYRIDDCGVGTVNRVQNANFETGVGYWTDGADVALPETDPTVWDSIIQAIVVNVSNYNEVRTTLSVTPAQSYTLSFDVVSSQPSTITEVSLQYGILSSSDTVIVQGEKSNAQLGVLPATLTLPFVGPLDGVVKIFIKTGAIGGVAKIKNVLVCDPAGACEAGYTKLAYDDFTVNKSGWGGGFLENQSLKLNSGCGIDCWNYLSASKQFSGLTPGSKFQVTINLKSANYANINLSSGGVTDQLTIGPTPGRYTHESVVRHGGSMVIGLHISAANYEGGSPGYLEIVFDDILTCLSAPIPCKNNVTNCRAVVRWQGVPRRPFNLFNSVIRYTIRDPITLNTTDYTYLPTIEQHMAATSCDLWKQQGNGGTAQDDILRSGLVPGAIGGITANTYSSVSGNPNWLWSVPLNAFNHPDQLTVYFPAPPAETLVEKVTIFFLEQYCQPTGSPTTPVIPPPLLCGTDPATEVQFGIMYTNNFGMNKEFTLKRHVNELWWQNVDFAALPLPWDTITAIGNGYKGSMARWDAFEFVLDSPDGKGLDQCTEAVDYIASSTSATISAKKFGVKGKAFFLEELVLPVVDPGPYEYPLPECDEVAICQSGPLLCKPGPGDGVDQPLVPCCDFNNVYAEANFSNSWEINWDLFDPHWPGCCGALTVRDLALKKNLNPSDYNPYVVNWANNTLVRTTYTQTIKVRQTIVLVGIEDDNADGRAYIMSQMRSRYPQIDVSVNVG